MANKKKETVVDENRADEIWDMIKKLSLNLFGLPNQSVEQHADRINVTDDLLHLKLKSPAVLPALEEAIKRVVLPKGQKFDVSQHKQYTVVSIVSDD